jgi:Co/Zn/Cd efflux system component
MSRKANAFRPQSSIGPQSYCGSGSSPPAMPSPYATVTRCYVAAQATLAVATSVVAAAQRDTLSLSRGVLQLASVLALLPVATAARGSAVVAAFAASVAMLVDALLRALAALHQVVHAGTAVRSTSFYVAVASAEAALSVVAFVVVARGATYNIILRRAFRRADSPVPRSATNGNIRRDPSQVATDMCLLVLFLHAVSCMVARGADLVAALGAPNAAWPAAGHASASILSMCLIYPPAKAIASVLLQETPAELASTLGWKLEAISNLDGVLAVHNVHFWEERLGICIGLLSLTVAHGIKASVIRRAVTEILGDDVDQLTVQVEEAALGSNFDGQQTRGDQVMTMSPSASSQSIRTVSPSRSFHLA